MTANRATAAGIVINFRDDDGMTQTITVFIIAWKWGSELWETIAEDAHRVEDQGLGSS